MLDSLHIQNFQTHADREIVFDPHVTTIVGKSDVGKSAIIRALRWLITNQPSGTAYIKHGEKEAKVVLRLDGKVIQRERSSTKNSYVCDGTRYMAIGTDIPDKVLDLLKIGDVNFQRQHDAPFWFSETAGEVSRQLNNLVDLHIIDSSMASAARTLAESRSAVRESEARLMEAKADRKRLGFVPKLCAAYDAIKALELESENAAEKCTRMGDLVENAISHDQTAKNASQTSFGLSLAVPAGESAVRIHNSAARLESMMENATCLAEDASITIPDLSKIERIFTAHISTKKRLENATIQVEDVAGRKADLAGIKMRLKQLQEMWTDQIGDVCPLCDQPISR